MFSVRGPPSGRHVLGATSSRDLDGTMPRGAGRRRSARPAPDPVVDLETPVATLERLRAPVRAGDRDARRARWSRWLPEVVALALAAAVLRIPAVLSTRHLLFDDGVYGASAVAMRHGALPFRDIFSSQGPFFLPLVYVFDLIGGRTLDAPRLLALTCGVVVTVATYAAGRQITDRPRAILAAALVACSGSVWWTTGPLTSDGPGVALACVTVVLALRYRDAPSSSRAWVIGGLAGSAFAVKSLLVVPALVAVALLMLATRRWRDIALACALAAAVVVIVSVPWGVGNVIDQSVTYHTDQATHQKPWANTVKTFSTLGDRDAPLLAFAILAAGFAGIAALRTRHSASRRSASRRSTSRGWDAIGHSTVRSRTNAAVVARFWNAVTSPRGAVAVWCFLAFMVLVFESPMWRNHIAHMAPPLALLVATYRPPWLALALAALVLVPYHVVHTSDLWSPTPYRGAAAVVEHRLKALPPHAMAISDDPGLVWRSGHRTPPRWVDASVLRIESDRPQLLINGETIAKGAAQRDVCALVVWSSRFGRFTDLPSRLQRVGYHRELTFSGGRALWTRPCVAR